MSTHDDEALLRLAGAVGDGTPVDWEREGAVHAGIRPHLRQLRVLEALIALHSGAPDDPPHGDPPAYRTSEQTASAVPGLAPGRILGGRYEVRTFLGEGGMGEVWLALDLKLRVEVALKSLRHERLGEERALELLRREVRAARQVASPNVCRIFDLVEADGQELVSMECVDGTTLAGVLRQRGPLDLREAAGIASQFLVGLDAIHGAGLVHRDIKPGNVMITRTGRVVLMDFGLAKSVTDDRDHSIVGTRPYMAPEQLRGESLDARTDIFAAGVVLAEMISVGGSSGQTAREALWAGAREEPPRLPETPWRPVLLRAIAKDPGQRHSSAQAMARALEEITLRVEGKDDRRPYPGLASFTEADAGYFFGREAEVEQMWRRLRWPHLQAIIGPSGAGKSSLLRAGLIPALPEGWRCVVCTPGSTPMMTLAQVIAPELAGDSEAVGLLPRFGDPNVVVGLFGRWRKRHEQALLIVDQFEELFTLSRPEVQARFAELLGRLALEADVHVLLSMRDDFLFHCHAHSPLAPIFSELTPLGTPAGSALHRALTQPALKCGYRFEDDALVEEMLAELKEERGALPLLAFAVARLWERRDRQNGLLTRAAYREIGGVGGALAQHAEATLEHIGTERQPLVREIFRNLVTAQGTRAVRDREELLSVFPDRERADGVLRALIDARLLTSFEVQEGEGDEAKRRQRVEIIHESLLSAWPRLVRWQTQDADSAQLRDQLRQAAQMWQERGRPVDLLWTGTSYREFHVWRERYRGGLSTTEDAFARAMVSHAERRRRRVRATVGGVIAALLTVVVLIGWYAHRAEQARRRAEANEFLARAERVIEVDPTRALAYSIASLERADSDRARVFALDALWRGPSYFQLGWDGFREVHGPAAFSPDGRWLAIGQYMTGRVAIWKPGGEPPTIIDTIDPKERSPEIKSYHVWQPLFGPASDVLFTGTNHTPSVKIWAVPGGKRIGAHAYDTSAGGGEGGHAPLHVSADGSRLLSLAWGHPAATTQFELLSWPAGKNRDPVHLGMVDQYADTSPSVDPTGKLLVNVPNQTIYLRSIEDIKGDPIRAIGDHEGRTITSTAFSHDGAALSSGDQEGGIRVWSIRDFAAGPLHTFEAKSQVESLGFAPDGTMLASGHGDGSARLWFLDSPDATPPLELPHDDRSVVSAVPVHPNGRWVLVSHLNPGAVLYPLGRSYPRVILHESTGKDFYTRGFAFSPDGSWIAASLQGPLRRLPLTPVRGASEEVLSRDLQKNTVVFDPAGRFLVAGGFGGVVFVALPDGKAKELPGFQGDAFAVAVSRDGRRIAAGGGYSSDKDQFVRVWEIASWDYHDLRVGSEITGLKFAEDGRVLFGARKNLYRWNVNDEKAELLAEGIVGGMFIYGRIDLSRDGRYVLAQNGIFDLETGGTRPLQRHGGTHLVFDPTGTIVVSAARDGIVRVGRVTDKAPHWLVGHKGVVNEVAVSPTGRWIASAGADGTLRLWPMPDLDKPPLHTLPYDELLARLRAQTNLRPIPDRDSSTGYRMTWENPQFRSWEDVPELCQP